MLEVASELVDLRAGIAELRGHGVEGADEDAEFVLDLFRDLIVEIARGDFAGAFGEGLDGDGDLFGKEESDPHGGGENQKSEEEENEEHLAFEGAKILLYVFVVAGLLLDDGPAFEEIGAGTVGGDEGALPGSGESDGDAGGEVAFILGLPDFDAAGQGVLQGALFAADAANIKRAVFLLVVADHAAFDEFAMGVEDPDGVEASRESVLEEGLGSFAGMLRGLIAQGVETRECAAAKIVQEILRFFGGDFEGPGEPAAEGAVEQGIADEEHEDDGEQRDGGGAEDHLGFEAGAEMIFAALGPQAHEAAGEDEAEDEQGGGDEAGDRVEGDDFTPGLRLEGDVERAEGEDGGEEQCDEDSAKGELDPKPAAGTAHREPSTGWERSGRRAHWEQTGARERQ